MEVQDSHIKGMIWLKILWGLGIFLFISFILWWYPFFAYPIWWQKAVRMGKSWFYLPQGWRGWRLRWIPFINFFIPLLGALLGFGAATSWFSTSTHPFALIFSLVFFSLCLVVQVLSFGKRKKQQIDAYWNLHQQLGIHYTNQGKDISDADLSHLTAFRHQNALREADQRGKLLRVLAERAKMTPLSSN